MRNIFSYLLVAASLALAGCAAGPDVQKTMLTEGKTFSELYKPKPGKGLVFIHRDVQMAGAAMWMGLYFDGPLGNLRVGSFFVIDAAPGLHSTHTDYGGYQSINVMEGEVQVWRFRQVFKSNPVSFKKVEGERGTELIKGSHFRGRFDIEAIRQLRVGMTRAEVHELLEDKPYVDFKVDFTGIEKIYTMAFRYDDGQLREWGFLNTGLKYLSGLGLIENPHIVKRPQDADKAE